MKLRDTFKSMRVDKLDDDIEHTGTEKITVTDETRPDGSRVVKTIVRNISRTVTK